MSHHKKRIDTNNANGTNLSNMLNNVDLNDILSKYSKDEEEVTNQESTESQQNVNNINTSNINELLNNIDVEELMSKLSMNTPKKDYSKISNNLEKNSTVNFINSIKPFVDKKNLPILDQLITIYAIGTLISNSKNKKN